MGNIGALKSLDKARSEGKRDIRAIDADDYVALVGERDEVQSVGIFYYLSVFSFFLSFLFLGNLTRFH